MKISELADELGAILTIRQKALDVALALVMKNSTAAFAEDLVKEAKVIEAFLMSELEEAAK